ncbi:unnamed protein product, partial [Hymenolepis diminuta]
CGSKRWVKRRHNSNWPNCLFSRSLFCVATFDFINFLIYLAPDMFSASRHAQRLAGNFLDDVDEFQRASRAADRRAMSHFDDAVSSPFSFVCFINQ